MKYLRAVHLLVYNSDSNSVYQYIAYITFPRATRLLRVSLVLPQRIYPNIPAVITSYTLSEQRNTPIEYNDSQHWATSYLTQGYPSKSD
jgi:hypothetical protein